MCAFSTNNLFRYSVNGGAWTTGTSGTWGVSSVFCSVSDGVYIITNGSTAGNLYVNTINTTTGLPGTWTVVNTGLTGMVFTDIIKLATGWLACGAISNVGTIAYCPNNNPATGWTSYNFTSVFGTLPVLNGLARRFDGTNTRIFAVGNSGTILSTNVAAPTSSAVWSNWYTPTSTELFTGSSLSNVMSVSSHPTNDLFTFAFSSYTPSGGSLTSGPVYSFLSGSFIKHPDYPVVSGTTGSVIRNSLITDSNNTVYLINNQGLFSCNITVKGTTFSPDNWRQIRETEGWSWGSIGLAINTNYGNSLPYICSAGASDQLFGTENFYYNLSAPSTTELLTAFNRTTPQVGDVISIQLNTDAIQQAGKLNYTFGLRCTAITSTGTASTATWSRVAAWVDGDMVVSGSITADSLAVNSIIAEKIQAGSITADKLSANTVLVNQSLQVGNPVVTGTTISSGSGAVITGGSTNANNIVAFGNTTSSMVVKDGVINFNGKVVPAKNVAFGVISDAILHKIVGPVGLSFPTMATIPNTSSTKLLFDSYNSNTVPTISVPTSDNTKIFKIHLELNLHVKIRVELFAGYIGMRVIRTNITDGGTPPETISNLDLNYDSIVETTKTWSNQVTPWGQWPHNLTTNLNTSIIESTADTATGSYQPIQPGKTYVYTVFLYAEISNTGNTANYVTVQPSTIVGDSTYIPSQQYYPEYGQLFTTVSNTLPETYTPIGFYGTPTYSNILTINTGNTNSLLRGMTVYGEGVPPRTVILSVLSSTQISLYTFTGDNFANASGYNPKIPGAVNSIKTYYFGPPLITGLTADNVIVFGNWTIPIYTQPRFSYPKINSNNQTGVTINPAGIYSGNSGSTIQLIGYYTQNIV